MPNTHEAVRRRRERVVAEMQKQERDVLVAGSPSAVAYLTDVDIRPFSGTGATVVVAGDGGTTLVIADSDAGFAVDAGFDGEVVTWRSGPGSSSERERLVRERSAAGALSPSHAAAERCAGAILDAAARVKDDDELRRIRQAANLADIGYTAVVDRMHPDLRVLEIVRNVDRSLRAAGGGGWWSPLEDDAGVTADSLYPHSSIATFLGRRAETGVLDRAEPLPFALYPLSEVYAGAAGTTIVLAEPSAELRSRASLLTDAIGASIAAARPGATGQDVQAAFAGAVAGRVPDRVASQSVGYSLGTGVGRPHLAAGSRDALEPGSVLSIRASLPGETGAPVAYQTTIVITPTGNDVLNIVPLRLIELY